MSHFYRRTGVPTSTTAVIFRLALLSCSVAVGCGGTNGSADAADIATGSPEVGTCVGETLSATDSAGFFPLSVGARWMFRSSGTSNGFPLSAKLLRRDVTGTKPYGDASAAVVSETDLETSSTSDEYLQVATTGLIYCGSSSSASFYGRPALFAVPFAAIPFPLHTCAPYQPYNLSDAKTPNDQDGDGLPETVAASASTLLSFEDLTVPVGVFKKALRVDTVENLTMTFSMSHLASNRVQRRTEWYASDVGLIKRYVETDSSATTSDLIAYRVADERRGVVPVGWLAQNLDESSNNPYRPNRPAVGFDGSQFLVIVPTSTQFDVGNLLAVVVDSEGNPVSSAPLFDSGNAMQSVALAWDGQRYLVAYQNGTDQRVELVTVSSAGKLLNGPVVLEAGATVPAVVATNDGFLVSYTVRTWAPASGSYVSYVWIATVDGSAHATSKVQPYPTSQQWSASFAKDSADGIMALFNTPPATPSPTLRETADILAVGRIAPDGHAVDATPIPVDAIPNVGHDETQLIFDGTNFVARWSELPGASTSSTEVHVARITPAGHVLDGATAGGGILIGNGVNSRIARFGAGSIMVWGQRLTSDYFSQGFGLARLTADGMLRDPPGGEADRWLVADNGAGWDSLSEILWAGDRALLVWATPASDKDVFSLGCAVAYPW